MSTRVREDRTSGYKYVDFFVDQSGRWNETITWYTGDATTPVVDVTGYDARLVVIRTGTDELPVLDMISSADITVGNELGTFSWDVPNGPMSALIHPVYSHELILTPGGYEDLAFPLLKGNVIVRPSAVPPDPATLPGVGWGHGPWGHFPWGS